MGGSADPYQAMNEIAEKALPLTGNTKKAQAMKAVLINGSAR
jgi:hypothetical protein